MNDSTHQMESIDTTDLTDRDLLRRFVQDADGQVFTEIVRRYHGLVMSVCRRVTGWAADAEDAFQASFLSLARRPRSIRRADALSSWLHTVAWRTSLRLVKQRSNESMETLPREPAHEPPGPLEQIASAQNLLVLDEELNRLPTQYRDVLVMTYVADQSNQQIADQLSVSRGTIDGRIRRGRNMLRVRLARRGVQLGVIGAATSLLAESSAATSAKLLATTTELGAQTLNNALPSNSELSQLEPLTRSETAMISTKMLTTGILCAAAAASAWGLYGMGEGEADDSTGSVQLNAAIGSA